MKKYGLYGLLAEFDTPGALVHASKAAHDAGYRVMDAYSPYPLEEAAEAIGFHKNRVSLIVLIGGCLGCLTGFSLPYWVSTIAYPVNVGGKPLNSWPAWIPITFELTVLFAALSAVVGMLVMNGLPMPYHPVFNAKNFLQTASKNKFFLCIEAKDPMFRLDDSKQFLEALHPVSVVEVEN